MLFTHRHPSEALLSLRVNACCSGQERRASRKRQPPVPGAAVRSASPPAAAYKLLIALVFLVCFAVFLRPCSAAQSKKVKVPKAKYSGIVFNRSQSLKLKAASGTKVYYTTNGRAPVKKKKGTKRYSRAIKISKSMTVRYCAYQKNRRSAVKTLKFVYLRPVSISSLTYRNGTISVKWKRNSEAAGYRVYRKTNGSSKWKRLCTLSNAKASEYIDSDIASGTGYSYYVASYRGKVESLKSNRAKQISTVHSHDSGNLLKYDNGYSTVETCQLCAEVTAQYLNDDYYQVIPSYWIPNVTSALKSADSRSELPGYVFTADPHWDMNAKRSPAIISCLIRHLKQPFAVCIGDIIATYHDNREDALSEIESYYAGFYVPLLTAIGNHDNNSNNNSEQSAYLSNLDLCRIFSLYAPASTRFCNDGEYSYFDDTTHCIRYITFSFDQRKAVSQEIIDCISDGVQELDESWSVVLFSHAYWQYRAAGTEPVPQLLGDELAGKLLRIQRESRANIVLWHVGHIHRDKKEVLSDEEGHTLLVVSSNCDSYRKSTYWGGLKMTAGTDTEQVIDIVQIDRKAQRIYMTRVGAGESRTMQYGGEGLVIDRIIAVPEEEHDEPQVPEPPEENNDASNNTPAEDPADAGSSGDASAQSAEEASGADLAPADASEVQSDVEDVQPESPDEVICDADSEEQSAAKSKIQ